MINGHYQSVHYNFQNGDLTNKLGENQGSVSVLSYTTLVKFDDKNTLKVRTIIITTVPKNSITIIHQSYYKSRLEMCTRILIPPPFIL